ncbi:hypothetical protein SODALDRAFT_2639 [Sodiomyces alkalinus F11]|uniref:Uncharacterized protein n=1 Tax=Sodiomyces alkalinus (strain CBS 110278 / VKM F-3762 / F11) TaxID=1314773 RepID=A0A3N2Q5C3_SODAK|nr:hypothetical protein SODALDRAFT_2639 [Sodiomyces alkalinus F11]ROT41897.1 hypothetical protein SODALDRAFT_2639 [Sodiomyces alkalinus F11]
MNRQELLPTVSISALERFQLVVEMSQDSCGRDQCVPRALHSNPKRNHRKNVRIPKVTTNQRPHRPPKVPYPFSSACLRTTGGNRPSV